MAVNRNVNIIKAFRGEPIGPVTYNISTEVFAIGGGGGGATDTTSGAGGGGGARYISGSVILTPNITYTFNVGSGASPDNDGGETYFDFYDGSYTNITKFKSQGGRTGTSGAGGNSGSGSVEYGAGGTTTFAAFTGASSVSGGGRIAGGGGAGSGENGLAGTTYDGNPGSGVSGGGGSGDKASYFIPASLVPTYAGAGGGGGATSPDVLQKGGGGGTAGGGAGQWNDVGSDASNFGSGGGGNGNYSNPPGSPNTGPGSGSDGMVAITFTGQIGDSLKGTGFYDIAFTNATSSYYPAYDTTVIRFNAGTGTLRYTAPYPYVPGN